MNILTHIRFRRTPGILAGLVLALAVTLPFIFQRDDSLTSLRQAGVMRIGYAVEAPYAYIGADGRVTGESPEVARAIIAALGIPRTEWVQTDFDLLIPGLLDRRYDVIAAGMFITPERAELVRFSNPTFHVQPGLLVRVGNPLRLQAYQNVIDDEGARIAVLSGSVEECVMREMGVVEPRLLVVPDALTGQTAVTSGMADALALSSVTVRRMVAADATGMTEAAVLSTTSDMACFDHWGYGGFVFRPDAARLADAWNEAQQEFVGSPVHVQLFAQFGFTPAELPGESTAAEILQP